MGKMTSTCSKSVLPKPSCTAFHPVQESNLEALKDFSGEGFNPSKRQKACNIVCRLLTKLYFFSEALYFFPVFLKQEMVRSKQLEQANLESHFFHSREDSLSKESGMSGMLATNRPSLVWKAPL